MGRWCRICGRTRPNEKFSGKGHNNCICKECSRKPRDKINEIDQSEEIFSFLKQTNISNKNIARLEKLKASKSTKVANLTTIVLEVAKVKPHKKRRLKSLEKENKELLLKLEQTGLIFAHHI